MTLRLAGFMLVFDVIRPPAIPGRDMMIGFLWTVLVVSVVVIGIAATVSGWLVHWARKGASGTEIIYLGLLPLFVAARLLKFAGAFSGLMLAALRDTPSARVAGVLGCVLLLMVGLEVVGHIRRRRFRKRLRHVIDQDEMLALIKSRAIGSFRKEQDGSVTFRYTEYEGALNRPTKADPQGYPTYVAAANDLRRQDGHTITYRNHADPHDPLSPGPRRVSVDEATALLRAAEIDTFAYGEPTPARERVPEAGDPTGITLIDRGWVRHLVVDSAMEATMIPIAREAQRQHGKPQIFVNGRTEQRSS